MGLRNGKRDRRLTIKAPTFTRDSMGGRVETLNDVATVWGGSLPIAGTRLFEAAQFVDGAQIRFELSYRADLTKSMLISFDGKDYQIVRIDEIGRRRGLYVWAKLP